MHKIPLLIFLTSTIFQFSTNSNSSPDQAAFRTTRASVVPVSVLTPPGVRYLTRSNFEEHVRNLYEQLDLHSYSLTFDVFRLGMVGYYSLKRDGAINGKELLTIIDFARPSIEKRFFTLDLKAREVKFHTYVSHGRNTGQNMATSFSNTPHSNQSSLGFLVTGETYVGSKGYSLRLDGKEKNFNDNVRSRAVVIHAAQYATEDWINRYGRLGRSQGCPALPPDLSKEIIDTIKDGSAIFTYYPDASYLNASPYLRTETLFEKLDESPLELAAAPTPLAQS